MPSKLSTQHPALSTEHSALSTQHSRPGRVALITGITGQDGAYLDWIDKHYEGKA